MWEGDQRNGMRTVIKGVRGGLENRRGKWRGGENRRGEEGERGEWRGGGGGGEAEGVGREDEGAGVRGGVDKDRGENGGGGGVGGRRGGEKVRGERNGRGRGRRGGRKVERKNRIDEWRRKVRGKRKTRKEPGLARMGRKLKESGIQLRQGTRGLRRK